jgi:peptidoglycan/xylan/chitin deacetylase (PgdA/CDA1 family)
MMSKPMQVPGKLARRGRAALANLRARLPHRPRPAILMYHRIADDSFDPWGTIVSPRCFADQLAWLARERTVLPVPDFAERHRRGDLPANAIAITFDDGYSCNAEVAAPLLEQMNLPATIFLPVEWIENGKPFWWEEIRQIVFDSEAQSLKLGGREIALGEKQAADPEWRYGAEPATPRQHAFRAVWLELLLKTPDEIERGMTELRSQFHRASGRHSTVTPLTPEQVRGTASAIIEFGSHALRHPALTSLKAADQAHEIGDSLGRCEALAGARPRSFAYPYGIFDEHCERLVEKAGFTCGCSTEHSAVGPASRNYALPRIQVGNWPARKLKRALALLPDASA